MRIKSVTLFLSAVALSACEPSEPSMEEVSALSEGCCGSLGLCVGEWLVSEQLAGRLPSSECQQAGEVCAPIEWVFGVTGVPTSCRAPGDLEGRCLPSCMPELADKAAGLEQQTCDAGFLCVPCFDPLTGIDTQACRIEPDPGPVEARGSAREQTEEARGSAREQTEEARGSAREQTEEAPDCVPDA